MGSGCIDPLIGGEWSASQYTPWGKSSQYLLNRRLDGSQNWSGGHEEIKQILTLVLMVIIAINYETPTQIQ
jgi:hypothetical protein